MSATCRAAPSWGWRRELPAPTASVCQGKFAGTGEPPFEDQYKTYDLYLVDPARRERRGGAELLPTVRRGRGRVAAFPGGSAGATCY